MRDAASNTINIVKTLFDVEDNSASQYLSQLKTEAAPVFNQFVATSVDLITHSKNSTKFVFVQDKSTVDTCDLDILPLEVRSCFNYPTQRNEIHVILKGPDGFTLSSFIFL